MRQKAPSIAPEVEGHTLRQKIIFLPNIFIKEPKPSSLSFGEGRGEAIDVSKLSAGIYFVEVDGGNQRWVRKFVKE